MEVTVSHDSEPAAADLSAPEERVESGSPPPCPDLPLTARVEALLFAAERPMSDGRIAELLGIGLEDGGLPAIRAAVDELNGEYERSGRVFRIESVAGGRQVMTVSEVGPVTARLRAARQQSRLSPAALETLAIIAYRQPILRAELEAIRGVACGEVLRSLLDRKLVRITGRAEDLGRPMLYGTTREFLKVFGLAGIEDLPQAKELRP